MALRLTGNDRTDNALNEPAPTLLGMLAVELDHWPQSATHAVVAVAGVNGAADTVDFTCGGAPVHAPRDGGWRVDKAPGDVEWDPNETTLHLPRPVVDWRTAVVSKSEWIHARREMAAMTAHSGRSDAPAPYQDRVADWLVECFGHEIAEDAQERNHRFLEEALELVQSLGCTRDEAAQLVEYVFARPLGEPPQEVGGVRVTLAALCWASRIDQDACAENELVRIWGNMPDIRQKQHAKPAMSPLPGVYPDRKQGHPYQEEGNHDE